MATSNNQRSSPAGNNGTRPRTQNNPGPQTGPPTFRTGRLPTSASDTIPDYIVHEAWNEFLNSEDDAKQASFDSPHQTLLTNVNINLQHYLQLIPALSSLLTSHLKPVAIKALDQEDSQQVEEALLLEQATSATPINSRTFNQKVKNLFNKTETEICNALFKANQDTEAHINEREDLKNNFKNEAESIYNSIAITMAKNIITSMESPLTSETEISLEWHRISSLLQEEAGNRFNSWFRTCFNLHTQVDFSRQSCPTVHTLQMEMDIMRHDMEMTKASVHCIKDHLESTNLKIGRLNNHIVEGWFEQEEYKVKLEATNKAVWKNLSVENRNSLVNKCLESTLPKNSPRPSFFITRGSDKFSPFVKVTFSTTEDKFIFEKNLKKQRSEATEAKDRPPFMSFRMTPQKFEPLKKELINEAKNKLTRDFIKKIETSQNNSYSNDPDAIKQSLSIRVQWKMKPFKLWLEYLDPIHKTCWAPVDMHSRDLFADYDLSQNIPCPHTREKAKNDKAYEIRRVNPNTRDYIMKPVSRFNRNQARNIFQPTNNSSPTNPIPNLNEQTTVTDNDPLANINKVLNNHILIAKPTSPSTTSTTSNPPNLINTTDLTIPPSGSPDHSSPDPHLATAASPPKPQRSPTPPGEQPSKETSNNFSIESANPQHNPNTAEPLSTTEDTDTPQSSQTSPANSQSQTLSKNEVTTPPDPSPITASGLSNPPNTSADDQTPNQVLLPSESTTTSTSTPEKNKSMSEEAQQTPLPALKSDELEDEEESEQTNMTRSKSKKETKGKSKIDASKLMMENMQLTRSSRKLERFGFKQ